MNGDSQNAQLGSLAFLLILLGWSIPTAMEGLPDLLNVSPNTINIIAIIITLVGLATAIATAWPSRYRRRARQLAAFTENALELLIENETKIDRSRESITPKSAGSFNKFVVDAGLHDLALRNQNYQNSLNRLRRRLSDVTRLRDRQKIRETLDNIEKELAKLEKSIETLMDDTDRAQLYVVSIRYTGTIQKAEMFQDEQNRRENVEETPNDPDIRALSDDAPPDDERGTLNDDDPAARDQQ